MFTPEIFSCDSKLYTYLIYNQLINAQALCKAIVKKHLRVVLYSL